MRSDGQASSSLVAMAMQIEKCKDVTAVVIMETLMGLDGIRVGLTNVFKGSPLLL